jgi:recombination protein RecA
MSKATNSVGKVELSDVLSSIVGSYQEKGIVIERGNIDCEFFDTGNLALNFALTGKFDEGWPVGHMTVISGDPSTGKSLIIKQAIAFFLKKYPDGVVILDDTERSFVKYLNEGEAQIDFDRFIRLSTNSVEEHARTLFDGVKNTQGKITTEPLVPKLFNSGFKHIMVAVDSMAAWSTEHELDVGLDKADMSKAKILKALFRIIKEDWQKYNVTYMATNHLIFTIGDFMSGPRKIEPGGGGPAFQASVRLCLALASKLKLKDNSIVGITVRAQTNKNRFAPPFRTCEFKIMYDTGLDKYSGLIELLKGLGLVKTGDGGWYHIVGTNQKFQSRNIAEVWPKLQELLKTKHVTQSDASEQLAAEE